MEFSKCLFIVTATTGSVLPFKLVWGRVANIELSAHCIAPSHRIARYTVSYWLEDPIAFPLSQSNPLTIIVNGLPYSEFIVEVPISVTSISDIERLCTQDFLVDKILGSSAVSANRYLNNLTKRLKRIDGYNIKASNINDSVINNYFVKAIEHLTVISGIDRSNLEITKSVSIITDSIGTNEFISDYTPDAEWVRIAARHWVTPNILRAIHTQRNSYQ